MKQIINLAIPGLKFDKNKSSYSFAPEELPASDHFFKSNAFSSKIEGGELHLFFGQKSLFGKTSHKLKAALEISIPVAMANIFLIQMVFDAPALTGDKTFFSILDEQNKNSETSHPANYDCDLELPDDSMYRSFAANYCSIALSNGQAMFEFFEANPSLVAHLAHGKPLRSSDGLKPVVAIIIQPKMMHKIFQEIKVSLQPFLKKEGGVVNEQQLESQS